LNWFVEIMCAAKGIRPHAGGYARPVTERDDDVRAFLVERHPEQAELALWLRAVVRGAEPDLSERVYRGWDGVGFRHPDAGYVCAIYPKPDGVRLWFEHGAALRDPERLLEGDGRGRFIALIDRAAVPAETLARYVTEAGAPRLLRA
jgi:hypothetical protein